MGAGRHPGNGRSRCGEPARRLAVLLGAALLAAGCGGGGGGAESAPTDQGTVPETRPTTAAPSEQTSFLAYFVRGEQVGVARRTVDRTTAVGAEAVRTLLAGPTTAEREAGLHSEIPEGVELLGLAIADGVATVDLSRAFESGGGSASMLARVAQVVYTLTQFPTVQRVAFRLDGEPVEAIGGEGVVVDPSVGRSDFEAQTPPILVESPAVGDTIHSPVRIHGTASVFEGTVQLTVVDRHGRIVAETFTTATEGGPGRGTFDATLEFAAEPGRGAVIVFTRSAADNSQQDVVEIAVEIGTSNQ